MNESSERADSGPAKTVGSSTGVSAGALAASHGSRPAGRPRKDGLRSGSAEAAMADRMAANERKRRFRLRQKALVASAEPNLPEDSANAVSDEKEVGDLPAVPWVEGPLRPLCKAIADGFETIMQSQVVSDCRKLGINAEQAAEFGNRAAWNAGAKMAVNEASPACAAEFLNYIGIGADKAHRVALLGGLGMIATQYAALRADIAKLGRVASHSEKGKTEPEPA